MDNTTYYQRDRDVALNKAKEYYKNNNERLNNKQEINIEAYLKKIRIKKENMEKIDITICLKKKEYRKQRYQEAKESRYNNE